jgi:proline dehydrogenase
VLLRAARRSIGGETLPECLAVASTLNSQGFATTIDHMGQSTRDAAMARKATDTFLHAIRAIAEQKLDSSVSLDLSHVGLAVDAGVAFSHARAPAQAARDAGLELMISMEGAERTAALLDLHRRLCERFDTVGITS